MFFPTFFFSQALKSQRLIVTYEVIIGIQQLLNVSGRDLTEPSWDVLCEIMCTIADNITYYGKNKRFFFVFFATLK